MSRVDFVYAVAFIVCPGCGKHLAGWDDDPREGVNPHRCEHCGVWFEINPEALLIFEEDMEE